MDAGEARNWPGSQAKSGMTAPSLKMPLGRFSGVGLLHPAGCAGALAPGETLQA